MAKSQSNRLASSRSGNLIVWDHGTMGRFAEMDLSRLPGVLDALKVSDVVGGALLNGLTQTVNDAGAMNRTDGEGNIIPAAEFWRTKKERMLRRIETLYRGEYATKPVAAETNLLREALEALADRSAKAADYLERFADLEPETIAQLKKSPAIVKEMNRIRMERAPKGGDELLDDLA